MIRKGLHVILDIDDVVLDWMDGFKNWLADAHNIILEIPPTGLRYSAIENCFPGLSRSEVFGLIAEFSKSQSFAHLQPYPGTKEFILAIAESGIGINALSSCGTGITEDLRRADLTEYLGWRKDWQFQALPLGASKYDALKDNFADASATMIDDHYGHILSARRAGVNGIWHRSNPDIVFCPIEDQETNEVPTTTWDECGAKLTTLVRLVSPETAKTLADNLESRNDLTRPQPRVKKSASVEMQSPALPF